MKSSVVKTKVLKTEKYRRPSWDEYFIEMMEAVAKRSTCDRGRCGTVIVRDKRILVTGYAGAPQGLDHCDDVGHQIKKTVHEDGTESQHCVRTVHSEQNAICQAARMGVALKGATVYTRMTPCRTCAMLLINCGVKKIVCQTKYHTGAESEEMLRKAGIEVVFLSEAMQMYKDM